MEQFDYLVVIDNLPNSEPETPAHFRRGTCPQISVAYYRRYRKKIQEIQGSAFCFSDNELHIEFGSEAAQSWESSSAKSPILGSQAAQIWE
jgi:hypothetical protein